MKTISLLIIILIFSTFALVGCDNQNEIKVTSTAVTQRFGDVTCNGFGGGCLPNCHIETDDETGTITLIFTPNRTYTCTKVMISYTGTTTASTEISFIDQWTTEIPVTIGEGSKYTFVNVEVSCNNDICNCKRYYTLESGAKPDDIGPIEIGTNCGREYYSHSFECHDGYLYVFCDDFDYDEYDPLRDPFRMTIDSYTIRTHIPGKEDDSSKFPEGGGYSLGTPVLLHNIEDGYATVYFYSSECKNPEEHCFYFTYSWLDDINYIENVHINNVKNHPTYQ